MTGPHLVVLGAGVIGLTTALTLRARHPSARITILAADFPGDYNIEYCSPWAGGNWCSAATDNGLLESFDRVTYERFAAIARQSPEAGIQWSPLRMIFDHKMEDAAILSEGTGKLWYDELVGGVKAVAQGALPAREAFGLDVPRTFVINTQIYLQWLLEKCRQGNVTLDRRRITHIREARIAADVTAVLNCTGLGSHSLGGVEDKAMYPTRGQTVLVEQPLQPLRRMYFRSPRRVDNDTTYVFQRPMAGGVVLGGCRQDGNWSGEVDEALAEDIMRRCCALAPELGRPEDLKIIRQGVGLRPGRKGGPRVEIEVDVEVEGKVEEGEGAPGGGGGEAALVVLHNYGHSGAGYQASWGSAEHGVRLLEEKLGLGVWRVTRL
ncbi:D-amino-acid oxidase like protein [Verticillium longisporum]|uniref:D-amino-acid oxidase like protein n=1 Tax=Verticillium longisporum TaxID=100787 RepID=A0A8I2ZBL6_VERLO|nr:D-amino-acid oxidase like protein [Verticillium longisporum]KAG7123308.1 D-amino-acid oxidase like protein [Verticillium longisporum]